ncbi:MAG: zf-HC2 domain-containing protein [Planctomycetes bacterium]|nr:zf-HC2 domain-containing protein [Planctomycetota bacterium]
MIDCNFDKVKLAGYLDGELSPEDASDVERHCAACPECARLLGELRRNDVVFRNASVDHCGTDMSGGNFNARLMDKIRKQGSPAPVRKLLFMWKFIMPPVAAAAAVALFLLYPVQSKQSREQLPVHSAPIDMPEKGGDVSSANANAFHGKLGLSGSNTNKAGFDFSLVRQEAFANEQAFQQITASAFAPADEEIDSVMKNSEAILIRFANSASSDADNLYSVQAFIQNSGILEQVNGIKNGSDDPAVADYFRKLEMVYLRISNADESKNGREIMSIQEAITSNGLIDETREIYRERQYLK